MNTCKYILLITNCLILIHMLYADDIVTLNQQQLQETQKEIAKQGNMAINKISQTTKDLSSINLKKLDLSATNEEIKQAQPYFNGVKPLTNKLPTGDKYYLFSESVVSDNQENLAQYTAQKQIPLDINQTISDYNAMLKNVKTQIADNRLLIFISSSMPKKSIIQLMMQATNLGAVFVIRGLIDGSYVKTYHYFFALKGDNNVGIMINPTLFKAFAIEYAPTFALYKSSQDLMQTACNVTPVYSKVTGEMTVHYALEQLSHSTIADLAQIASNELALLDNNQFYKGN